MDYKYHRAIGISALTLLMVMMMFSADYIYMRAWALTVTTVNNTNNTTGIVRLGSQIFVSSDSANLIEVWQSGVKVGTVASTDPATLHAYNGKIYSFDYTNIVVNEYTPVSGGAPIYIRTSSALTSCVVSTDPRFEDNKFFCSTGTGNTIKTLDLDTFTITTSATVNTGASACNNPIINVYDSASDTMFLDCSTSGNIAVVEGWTASQTPDFSVAHIANNNDMAFDPLTSKLIGCEVSGTRIWIYDYTAGAAPTLSTTITVSDTTECQEDSIFVDPADRVLVFTANEMAVIDPDSESLITTVSGLTASCSPTAKACDIFGYSSTLAYVTSNTANYYVIDLTGVGAGGGGPTPASICYIDLNADGVANLVYYDTTGPEGIPDGMCDGSVLDLPSNDPSDCESNGLARLIAAILGIDCDQDPNPQTNGIGMIYMLFLGLFVIGFIFAGARKFNFDMTSIHPAVWMFFAVGITGFSWQIGWVDSIVFYAMIIVCAGVGAFGLYQKLRNSG